MILAIRDTIIVLSMVAAIALWAFPALGQQVYLDKNGDPYIPGEAVLQIYAEIVQCGTLDEAIDSCKDGNDICCQLIASATGS